MLGAICLEKKKWSYCWSQTGYHVHLGNMMHFICMLQYKARVCARIRQLPCIYIKPLTQARPPTYEQRSGVFSVCFCWFCLIVLECQRREQLWFFSLKKYIYAVQQLFRNTLACKQLVLCRRACSPEWTMTGIWHHQRVSWYETHPPTHLLTPVGCLWSRYRCVITNTTLMRLTPGATGQKTVAPHHLCVFVMETLFQMMNCVHY